MESTVPKSYPAELDMIKDIFFNAPIQNADCSVFDYFKENTTFRYEKKKGNHDLEYRGNTYTMWISSFYFDYHPILPGYFDTGRVIFCKHNFPPAANIFQVTLELRYSDEGNCHKAYDILSEKLQQVKAESVRCHNNDFDHFKRIFFTYRQQILKSHPVPRIVYELDQRGDDGSLR